MFVVHKKNYAMVKIKKKKKHYKTISHKLIAESFSWFKQENHGKKFEKYKKNSFTYSHNRSPFSRELRKLLLPNFFLVTACETKTNTGSTKNQ